MNKNKVHPIIQALLAALLFGASAPLSKLLLVNIEPVPLASFLYLGSGTGLFIYKKVEQLIYKKEASEAPLTKKEIPWVLGSILLGGVLAPILLMSSLKITPASTSSLLLNFEGVATTLIALVFFKENIGKRVWFAIACITISSILLSWDFSNKWGVSIGALGIIGTCFCWGIDNNFTRNVSSKNPFSIVIIKGFCAGFFSLLLSLILRNPMPNLKIILIAMLLGFFSYGLSIVLFVFAMRSLGSSRTSAFFGTAPFIGTILAFTLFNNNVNIGFFLSLPIMILGTVFLLKDNHNHMHKHENIKHEHRHFHTDGHHNHTHIPGEVPPNGYHSHEHIHEQLQHLHTHTPDIEHRHTHDN